MEYACRLKLNHNMIRFDISTLLTQRRKEEEDYGQFKNGNGTEIMFTRRTSYNQFKRRSI